MNYLIQSLNAEGRVIFADIVSKPAEIRQVIEIGANEPIRFTKDVFVHTEHVTGIMSVVTRISDERAVQLYGANKLPATYLHNA